MFGLSGLRAFAGGSRTLVWSRERDGGVEHYEIEGTVAAYRPPRLSCHPDERMPAEGGEVEIGRAWQTDEDGTRLAEVPVATFTAAERRRIEEALFDLAAQR